MKDNCHTIMFLILPRYTFASYLYSFLSTQYRSLDRNVLDSMLAGCPPFMSSFFADLQGDLKRPKCS